MHPLYDVTAFEIIANYTLRVKFDDNTEQIINFEPVLHGEVYDPLRDLRLFNQVRLDAEVGTLVALISGLHNLNDPWSDLVNWFQDMMVNSAKYAIFVDAMRKFANPGECIL